MSRFERRSAVSIVGLALLAWANAVDAEPVHIVLIHPKAASYLVPETLTRVRGELVADGFDVSVEESPGDAEPSMADFELHSPTVAAIVGISLEDSAKPSKGEPSSGSARIWIVDRLTRKTVVRVVAMDRREDGTPEILARRAVDLLRASLLELLMPAQQPRDIATPAAEASRWAAKGIEVDRGSRWGAEAGVAVLAGTQGIGAAVLPTARLRLALSAVWTTRATLAGLGTRPRVNAATGSATVAQEIGVFDLSAEPWGGSVRPFVSAGVGGYHVSATGEASWPYEGRTSSRWSFAAMAGGGASFRLASPLELCLEGHALFLTPYPVVRFLGVDAAGTGRPAVLASVSVVGHL